MSGSFSPHPYEDRRDSWPDCIECGCRFDPNDIAEDGELVCPDCRDNPKCDRSDCAASARRRRKNRDQCRIVKSKTA